MERTRENQRKMPFSPSRRRSRGIVSKESSGIWKVENDGIDSIRERYKIKDRRLNGRTGRRRLIRNGSSDESFDGEMTEARNGRTVINKAKLKVYDEVIGVPVPRRTRTGLKRKPQESITTAQPPNASKGSRKEMDPISESEVEVAKFLFGLTKLHSKHSDAVADTVQSSSVPDISASSDDSKRKKSSHLQSDDTEKTSMMIICNSRSDGTTSQVNATSLVPTSSISGQQADRSSCVKEVEASSPKLDKVSSLNNSGQSKIEAKLLDPQNVVSVPVLGEEKPNPTSPINAELFMSPDHHEKPNSVFLKKEDGNSNAYCNTEHKQTDQLTEQKFSQLKPDLPLLSSQNEKLDPHNSASLISSIKDCVKKVKYEIDLMALPDDREVDATDECNPQMSEVSDFNQGPTKAENSCKSGIFGLSDKEIVDSKQKQSSSVPVETHAKGVAKNGVEKQLYVQGEAGSCRDHGLVNKIGAKQHSQKIVKDAALTSGRAGLSNNNTTAISAPTPISIPCWPGGIRSFGLPSAGSASLSVTPSLQGASPVEGNTLMRHAPIVMLPPKRPGHCATHCFIARLVRFQQQLVKLNPFLHSSSSSSKPYSLSALPKSSALLLGGPVIGNQNAVTNSGFGSGSVVSLNCQYPVANHSGSLHDTEKGRHLLLQQSHQLLFPINQVQGQVAGQKAANPLSENGNLLSTSSAPSASASTSTNCSNLAAVPDPRYLTMFKGNYPLPNTAAYQSNVAEQQRPPPSHFHGSSNSSQLYTQPLKLTPNPPVSASEKRLQARQFLHSPKISSESQLNKPEHSRNGGVPHSWISMPAGKHCQPPGILTNQATTLLKAHSSNGGRPSELSHLRKQVTAQTNSPISALSTSVSISSSMACSDRNNPQECISSSLKMPKPEISLDSSSRKVMPMPALTPADKTKRTFSSNSVLGCPDKSVQLTFPGSLNMRKPTVSQRPHLGSLMGLPATSVSYVQEAASVPMKSAEQKPEAA